MNRVLSVVLVFCLVAMTGWSAPPKKVADLMKDDAFSAASAEQRLEWLNAKIDKKEMSSSEVSSDIVTRLFFDRLKDDKDAVSRLDT